jgi:hypothetical protein
VITFQRVIALLMAVVMVCFFLVPLAWQRHAYPLAYGLIALLAMYLAANAYLFARMRKQKS